MKGSYFHRERKGRKTEREKERESNNGRERERDGERGREGNKWHTLGELRGISQRPNIESRLFRTPLFLIPDYTGKIAFAEPLFWFRFRSFSRKMSRFFLGRCSKSVFSSFGGKKNVSLHRIEKVTLSVRKMLFHLVFRISLSPALSLSLSLFHSLAPSLSLTFTCCWTHTHTHSVGERDRDSLHKTALPWSVGGFFRHCSNISTRLARFSRAEISFPLMSNGAALKPWE